MEREEFEQAVSAAIDSLPEEFGKQMENVEVVIEQWPTGEDLRRSRLRSNSLLFGLYQGVPKTKRGIYYSALPDKITIFAGPILWVARSTTEAKKIIRDTVLHEIGHHFGMSEAQIRRAQRKTNP